MRRLGSISRPVSHSLSRPRSRQHGASLVEITLSILILAVLLTLFVDVSRWLHAWSAAGEATRLGARLAALCERGADGEQAIREQMRMWLPDLSRARAASVIRIDYEDPAGTPSASCDARSCRQVSVWLDGHAIAALGGLVPGGQLPLPAMRASVVRESLQSRTGACAPVR